MVCCFKYFFQIRCFLYISNGVVLSVKLCCCFLNIAFDILLFSIYFSRCCCLLTISHGSSLHYVSRPFFVAPGIADVCLAPDFCCNFHDWWESLWFNCLILEFGVREAFCYQYHSLNGAELHGREFSRWGRLGWGRLHLYLFIYRFHSRTFDSRLLVSCVKIHMYTDINL